MAKLNINFNLEDYLLWLVRSPGWKSRYSVSITP